MRSPTPDAAASDLESLTNTALDYLEGWFEGDQERMERALHPQLAKRSLERTPSGDEMLETLTADQMVRWTADGRGKSRDIPDRGIDVKVGHLHGDIGTVTVTSAIYVEYLHLVRTHSGWRIVNVLWAWASDVQGGNR